MYRKILAFAFITLFAVTGVSAQTLGGIGGIGVKGGVNFAQLRGEDESTDRQLDFVAGVYGIIPTSRFFVIQPEVLYTRKGGTADESDGEADFNLDYIEVPVLAKVTFPTQAGVVPSLVAGPYAAYAVNKDLEGIPDEAEVDDFVKDFDFGVALGAEVDFVFAGRSATLSGRYDLGLLNVNEDEVGGDELQDIRTGTISVTLGFAL